MSKIPRQYLGRREPRSWPDTTPARVFATVNVGTSGDRRQPADRVYSGLLRQTLGETILLETVLSGGFWPTHADAGQLENAVLNLAINSRDAMPEGGKVTIETNNTHFDGDYVRDYEDLPAGQYLMIAVSDQGSGMTPEVMTKAFDPFFTTKPLGKGTGLGLSQVYGFVRQSKGHLKLYSEIDHGTTVKIYLPRYCGAKEATAEIFDNRNAGATYRK